MTSAINITICVHVKMLPSVQWEPRPLGPWSFHHGLPRNHCPLGESTHDAMMPAETRIMTLFRSQLYSGKCEGKKKARLPQSHNFWMWSRTIFS